MRRHLPCLLAERLVVEGLAGLWALAVPLRRDRLRQRGFNQAELLARELRGRLALTRPPGALVRVRATPPQVGHDRLWRKENVRGAFIWEGVQIWPESLSCCSTTWRRPVPRWRLARWRSGNPDRGPVTGVLVARVILCGGAPEGPLAYSAVRRSPYSQRGG